MLELCAGTTTYNYFVVITPYCTYSLEQHLVARTVFEYFIARTQVPLQQFRTTLALNSSSEHCVYAANALVDGKTWKLYACEDTLT